MDHLLLQAALKVRPCRSAASETQTLAQVVTSITTITALAACHAWFDRNAVALLAVFDVRAYLEDYSGDLMAQAQWLSDLYGPIAAFQKVMDVRAA